MGNSVCGLFCFRAARPGRPEAVKFLGPVVDDAEVDVGEAHDPLQRRDYQALRCLSGTAPVTRRSGKSVIVVRRLAAHNRLQNAVYHWAGSAIQHDAVSRAKYTALRARGHGHARALRSVADRLLAVACAMLENQTLFAPDHPGRRHAA